MKFTCDRSALVDKLGVLARGVSTRSALPVLSGILLQAGEGRLDLYSTDMELSIKANFATPVETEGEIVVPARLFSDVIRNLPDEDVVIEAGDAAVKVSAGRAAFSLNSWAAARLPADIHIRHGAARSRSAATRSLRHSTRSAVPPRATRRDPSSQAFS